MDLASPRRRTAEDAAGFDFSIIDLRQIHFSLAPGHETDGTPPGNGETVVGRRFGYRSGPEDETHLTDIAKRQLDVVRDDVADESFHTVLGDLIGDEKINGFGALAKKEERLQPSRAVEQCRELGLPFGEAAHIRSDLTSEEAFTVSSGDLDQSPTREGSGHTVDIQGIRR